MTPKKYSVTFMLLQDFEILSVLKSQSSLTPLQRLTALFFILFLWELAQIRFDKSYNRPFLGYLIWPILRPFLIFLRFIVIIISEKLRYVLYFIFFYWSNGFYYYSVKVIKDYIQLSIYFQQLSTFFKHLASP